MRRIPTVEDLNDVLTVVAKKSVKFPIYEDIYEDSIKGLPVGEREMNGLMGALYYLNETEQKYVDDFEESSDCIVYHVIHAMTESGELYSMLYVSPYEEEWEYDREGLESGIVMANVYNATYGFTDMGSIGVRPSIGGLVRTA